MRREEIPEYFLNRIVKLVKADGFVLTGKIQEINKDNLLFITQQATSLISLDNVREIVFKKEENNDKTY